MYEEKKIRREDFLHHFFQATENKMNFDNNSEKQ
jgi:hypothetical protein